MKKSLIALAALGAFAGAAHAQSSVTLYGLIDSAVRYDDHADAAGKSNITLGQGAYAGSRWGLKGVEDLGGGLKAIFQLESGFEPGTGNSGNASAASGYGEAAGSRLFSRQAWVGLQGPLGSVKFGRQDTITRSTIIANDPFAFSALDETSFFAKASGDGAGTTDPTAYVTSRNDNMIRYEGSFDGLKVGASYTLGEQAANKESNRAFAVSAGYTYGPYALNASYENAKSAALASPELRQTAVVGGTATFGALKYFANFIYTNFDKAQVRSNLYTLGAKYGITPAIDLTGAVYFDDRTNANSSQGKRVVYAALAEYKFSKRTSTYLEVDYTDLRSNYSALSLSTAAGSEDHRFGAMVGIKHAF